jgi:hypothetical protein
MLDAIKPLLDSQLINESTGLAITEAFEAKLNEAREQVRAELREEFAQRYEHDKSVMVEALDRMVTEGLQAEMQEFQEERRGLNEDRVRFQVKMKESAEKFNNFMVGKLAEEIKELRSDRRTHTESVDRLERFVIEALAREITEFAQDKRDVVNTKVKLVSEAKKQLTALKQQFVKESAAKLGQRVAEHLRSELTQLKEDVRIARENNFGRRIFEAYVTEFAGTHLNENAEVRKLKAVIADKEQKLAEAIESTNAAKVLVENKEREVRMIKESTERSRTMEELLNPLNEEKAEIMRNLLESVQTPRLRTAFEKYLPAVLDNAAKKVAVAKQTITESVHKEVTGDKSAVKPKSDDASTVIELKRLAGL